MKTQTQKKISDIFNKYRNLLSAHNSIGKIINATT